MTLSKCSSAGNIVNKKRATLDPDQVDGLVFWQIISEVGPFSFTGSSMVYLVTFLVHSCQIVILHFLFRECFFSSYYVMNTVAL